MKNRTCCWKQISTLCCFVSPPINVPKTSWSHECFHEPPKFLHTKKENKLTPKKIFFASILYKCSPPVEIFRFFSDRTEPKRDLSKSCQHCCWLNSNPSWWSSPWGRQRRRGVTKSPPQRHVQNMNPLDALKQRWKNWNFSSKFRTVLEQIRNLKNNHRFWKKTRDLEEYFSSHKSQIWFSRKSVYLQYWFLFI